MSDTSIRTDNGVYPGGYIGRIPVRNLWLLMLYASDLYRSLGVGKADLEDSPDELPDLIAEILAEAVELRLARRLSLGYEAHNAKLNRVRGQIDILTTERQQLLARGLIACRFDELTLDTPRNRFVRGALESIAKIVQRNVLARRCRTLANALRLMGVSHLVPSRAQLSKERFGLHDADDKHMVTAAKLAFDLALPTESSGTHALSMPDREARWIRRLFERAVGGFYQVALKPKGWHVCPGRTLVWPIEQKTSGIDKLLPTMRTDVVLDCLSTKRRIIVDTKFTSIVTQGCHREESLSSAYLYPIYAYLQSQTGSGDELADQACGLLLHPAIESAVDETVVIQGHAIRFATLDLSASAAEIRLQLLNLCKPWAFDHL